MIDWRLGTVGFGYKAWLGSFYPEPFAADKMLSFYSLYFNSAEVDTTFYGVPREQTVRNWHRRAPADFIFCPKTPRDISHSIDLLDQVPTMHQFIERMQILGNKLGAILIQFPPSFRFDDQFDVLQRFLAQLPTDVRYAIEFRDLSWRKQRTLALLAEHNCAWVCADYVHLPPDVLITADFTYLRFIGTHGAFATKDREQIDQTERLKTWYAQLEPHLATTHTVFGYFNNDFSGHSPITCNRFKALLGLPAIYPQHLKQQRLF